MSWEAGDAIGAYGTPLALMLLPYWTDGRIQSMEGLYFESSTTTPYHFMMIATLAQSPSNPVRGLPYRSIADFDLGVRYLQLMGVRYYAAFTDRRRQRRRRTRRCARSPPSPTSTTGRRSGGRSTRSPTRRRAGARLRAGGRRRPARRADVAVRGRAEARREHRARAAEFSPWECLAVPWFDDPAALDRPLTDDGPASWSAADAADAPLQWRNGRFPTVKVSNVRTTESSVSFDVSRTGVPVMVKTSYFPNWQADGADGPWRATPNFMVVVPTSQHVRLTYGTSTADWVGRVLTVVGVLGLGGLVWWGLAARRTGRFRC